MTELPAPAKPAKTFRTRTDVLFASRADVAVVLRRGPRKHWQLVHWNTSTDTFTPGQWMKGVVGLCDLSPDGRKLIYFAAQEHPSAPWRKSRMSTPTSSEANDGDDDEGTSPLASAGFDPLVAASDFLHRQAKRHPRRKLPRYMGGSRRAGSTTLPSIVGTRDNQGTWTAVSTPPYFSALAIWPSNGRWTGGGYFHDNNTLHINETPDAMRPILNARLPARIRIEACGGMRHMTFPTTIAASPRRTSIHVFERISATLLAEGAKFVDWVYPTQEGDILFACDGAIYRHTGTTAEIAPNLLHSSQRLIDLAPARFELLRAPDAAMRW